MTDIRQFCSQLLKLMIKRFLTVCLLFVELGLVAQEKSSSDSISGFSGSVGITNNGFSIIPTFSLNSPAAIVNLAWQKKRFSFEPDIRLVPDASKGGLIWWFRYRLVERKKFAMRVGAHPAFSLVRRNITENGSKSTITEMLRLAAFEIVPSYQISKRFGVSAMFLEGHGLQKHGPQTTRVLFLNTALTPIPLSAQLRLHLFPTLFFLNTDGFKGNYFTMTAALSHNKSPFKLQSTINQTFTSNVPGNKEFMWNVLLGYGFSRKYKRHNPTASGINSGF